jgi:hypothetical protein
MYSLHRPGGRTPCATIKIISMPLKPFSLKPCKSINYSMRKTRFQLSFRYKDGLL